MKSLISFITTLLMVALMANPLSSSLHVSCSLAFTGMFFVLVAAGAINHFCSAAATNNLFTADLLTQIWIKQLMDKFYDPGMHLTRSVDMSEFVNNNVIHLADAGVDPDVLVNNSTYPIATMERADSPLELALDRYRTKNTVIRDAEAVQLAYSKLENVIAGHRNKLREETIARATHAWAPDADGTYTPVFETSGEDRADGSSRKALTVKDVAKARRLFDKLKVPQTGRVLVLCPEHQEDLINEDTNLFKQFANMRSGEVLQIFGFDVYVSTLTATYNSGTGAKKAYGAADAGTDSPSTLIYHEGEVMRADGDVTMFARLRDPEADGDIVGFAKRFIGLPIRGKYQMSIYSAAVS